MNVKAFTMAEEALCEVPGSVIVYDWLMFERPCDIEGTYFYNRCEPNHPQRYCCVSDQTLCDPPPS